MAEAFELACKLVKRGSFPVDDDEKLIIYALYKLATTGHPPEDAQESLIAPVQAAKLRAWREFAEQVASKNDAALKYVQLVEKLSVRGN